MSRYHVSRSRAFALAPLLVLALARPALAADDPKGQAAFFIGCLTVIPLALVPLGLAFHLLLRALCPRFLRQVVHVVEAHRTRTAITGFVTTLVLSLVFVATAEKAPPVAHLTSLVFFALAFAGTHGVARAIGARALGSTAAETLGPARSEVRELAVGWFVVSYVGCFPFLGWIAAAWWLVRGLGATIVALVAGDLEREAPTQEKLPGIS